MIDFTNKYRLNIKTVFNGCLATVSISSTSDDTIWQLISEAQKAGIQINTNQVTHQVNVRIHE
jgi:hypothetical protein